MPEEQKQSVDIKKPKKKKNLGGRPTVMTPLTISKLEEAFSLGCSDLEACVFAGISHQSLYEYQKKNPKYAERKTLLKENATLLARTAVIKAFKENPTLALKYLERKKKKEFSLRLETDITSGGESLKGLIQIK